MPHSHDRRYQIGSFNQIYKVSSIVSSIFHFNFYFRRDNVDRTEVCDHRKTFGVSLKQICAREGTGDIILMYYSRVIISIQVAPVRT